MRLDFNNMKIDPKLFTVERLLETMLDHEYGNVNIWMHEAEIIPNYMPPYPHKDTKPKVVVKWRNSFLRYSKGPRQGYMWDIYGDDMHTSELALLALLQSPVPPSALDGSTWAKISMENN